MPLLNYPDSAYYNLKIDKQSWFDYESYSYAPYLWYSKTAPVKYLFETSINITVSDHSCVSISIAFTTLHFYLPEHCQNPHMFQLPKSSFFSMTYGVCASYNSTCISTVQLFRYKTVKFGDGKGTAFTLLYRLSHVELFY
ncbi:hypothetical protein A3Q56_08572 [Intoshia linei]|uniref:Uncharacterized protein n=1 Tax=Intoshia linei TaxID=1819745 RepID=A0A177AQN7_9BILA|nr:hypothetical protein A3Q56_08572 [Intoshia linei]